MTLMDIMFTQSFIDNMPDGLADAMPAIVLFVTLAIFLLMGVPIAFAIGISAFFTIFLDFPLDKVSALVSQHLASGLNNFAMLALPFFIFAGNLMNRGGLAKRLINFAMILGGKLPGSLAHVNVIANMMFGSLSGSAVAAAAAIGGIVGPLQDDQKYPKDFSCAVNVASCPSGLLIPPSNILILYALVSQTSVQYLFLSGYLPGILMGVGIMVGILIFGKKFKVPQKKIKLEKSVWQTTIEAFPSLFMVVIIMGGIVWGVFTATEASAIAVVYSLVLGFAYKELKLKDLPATLIDSVVTTSIVLLMIATSSILSYAMTYADIPSAIASMILAFSKNPIIIMILINIILLIVGTFMDMAPAVLIFTPIFLPMAKHLGVDPLHFGIIMVFNLCIGICTPPVGTALFVGCSISRVQLSSVVRKLMPLFVIMLITLVIVNAIPGIALWLPKISGYTG